MQPMRQALLSIAMIITGVILVMSASAQVQPPYPGAPATLASPFPTPAIGSVDPCAGTGAVGSNSYGACQLRQQTLSRGVVRTPDLSGLDRSKQMYAERVCASDLALGQSVYAACLRRELGTRGYDPNTPMRPLPDTQRSLDAYQPQ